MDIYKNDEIDAFEVEDGVGYFSTEQGRNVRHRLILSHFST